MGDDLRDLIIPARYCSIERNKSQETHKKLEESLQDRHQMWHQQQVIKVNWSILLILQLCELHLSINAGFYSRISIFLCRHKLKYSPLSRW